MIRKLLLAFMLLGALAQAQTHGVRLNWTQSSTSLTVAANAIYRRLWTGSYARLTSIAPATTYLDTTAVLGTRYCYVVSATAGGRESSFSNEACVLYVLPVSHPQPVPPPAPAANYKLYLANTEAANGVAPGYWPTKGSGLTLNLGKGTANCIDTLVEYAGGTLTLADASTNYVYLDPGSSCAPASSTSSFGAASIWIAKATAAGGVITAIDDVRVGFVAPGAGGVNSVAASFTGGLISLSGGPITGSGSFALTVAGTSGGIPYFNSAATWLSSGALGVGLPVLGGGAGGAPTSGTVSGDTTAFIATTGTLTPGDCADVVDSTLVDAGAACNSGVSATGSPVAGNLAKFSGASSLTNGDLSGDLTTSGTLASALAAKFKVRTCTVVIGDPGAASVVLANDNDLTAVCGNKYQTTLTITAVECYADAGSPTMTPIITGGSSTSILTGALTCGTGSFASGTLNGTPTETDGQSIDANITAAGGTAKYIVIRITRTL